MVTPEKSARAVKLLGIQAVVDDVPTYDLASAHQHDPGMMAACCNAEEETYWRQESGTRISAAPFYFQRVAILSAKNQDYESELSICLRWQAIINDYKSQPMVKLKKAALVHKGPRSIAIIARIPKAKARLKAQKIKAKK